MCEHYWKVFLYVYVNVFGTLLSAVPTIRISISEERHLVASYYDILTQLFPHESLVCTNSDILANSCDS
jgi:hypothetical protein